LFYRNNFLLKTIMDAWEASMTIELLYRFLYIRPENIVYMVTDNASNYVVASELLMEEFPSISWSSCVVYYINLILQKNDKLQLVCFVINHVFDIIKYIYNHCFYLYLMRKFNWGKEIRNPASTCFNTNFIALQSILVHR
jgi:hypothetical protein